MFPSALRGSPGSILSYVSFVATFFWKTVFQFIEAAKNCNSKCKAVSSLFSICIGLSCVWRGKDLHFSDFKINLIPPFHFSPLFPILIPIRLSLRLSTSWRDVFLFWPSSPCPPPPAILQRKYTFYQIPTPPQPQPHPFLIEFLHLNW